ADLPYAEPGEDARKPRDLLEGKDGAVRQEFMAGVEHLPRHAVDAAEVAAVRDGDPQVAHRAAERIEELAAAKRRRRDARRPAGNDGNDLRLHGCMGTERSYSSARNSRMGLTLPVPAQFPGLGAVSGDFGPASSPFCWKSRCCAGLLGSTCPCWGLAPSFFSSCEAVWPELAAAAGVVGVLTCGVVGVLACDCGGAEAAPAAGFVRSEPLLHPAAKASTAARARICRRMWFSP